MVEAPYGSYVNVRDYNALEAELKAAYSLGDALAHQLMHKDHGPILDHWWNLRGGIDQCTVCNLEPQQTP